MRLKSEIWVKAYLRRCVANGAMAVVARHGDDDAGAIFIKVQNREGQSIVLSPAPAGRDEGDVARQFTPALGGRKVSNDDADTYLQREVKFDADVWLIDVEDRDTRHFLTDDEFIAAGK